MRDLDYNIESLTYRARQDMVLNIIRTELFAGYPELAEISDGTKNYNSAEDKDGDFLPKLKVPEQYRSKPELTAITIVHRILDLAHAPKRSNACKHVHKPGWKEQASDILTWTCENPINSEDFGIGPRLATLMPRITELLDTGDKCTPKESEAFSSTIICACGGKYTTRNRDLDKVLHDLCPKCHEFHWLNYLRLLDEDKRVVEMDMCP
jgi:hypothetical protein